MNNKILFLFLLCTSLNACQSQSVIQANTPADRGMLVRHVRALTDAEATRTYYNPHILNNTAAYITEVFSKYSGCVSPQIYKADGVEYKNIICSFGPEAGERIIIGAHYDVFGDQPGADDNASGVAGLLEIARLLAGVESMLRYRVDLVAFTLEEQPFFKTPLMGSAVHAASLIADGVKVRLMVCLEMIGYYSDKDDSQQFPIGLLEWFYPSKGDFILIVSNFSSHFSAREFRINMRKKMDTDIQGITSPSFVTGVDFSDHYNYWKEGYRAIMVTDTAFFRNGHYHQVSDTPETLNFDKMSDVVNGVFHAVINLK